MPRRLKHCHSFTLITRKYSMYILLTDVHMKDAVFILSQELNHIACALTMLCLSLAFKDTVGHKSLQRPVTTYLS